MQTAQDAAAADAKAFDSVVRLASGLYNACRWSDAEKATDACEEAGPATNTSAVPRVLEFGLYMRLAEPFHKNHLRQLIRERYSDAPWKAARICNWFYSDVAAVVVAEFLTALPSDAHHDAWSLRPLHRRRKQEARPQCYSHLCAFLATLSVFVLVLYTSRINSRSMPMYQVSSACPCCTHHAAPMRSRPGATIRKAGGHPRGASSVPVRIASVLCPSLAVRRNVGADVPST